MFKPQFSYTSKIVNNLVEIASARAIILTAYLVPKWEVSLRREALIRATHASTAIEGNPLTLDEVSKLAQGRQVTATRKAKQEVLNYLHVLEKIDEFQEDGVITEQSILAIHKALTRETLDNPEWEGKYREIQVVVGNRITGEIQKMFGISRQATHTELKNLMELDIIEQKGAGKSTYYVMK